LNTAIRLLVAAVTLALYASAANATTERYYFTGTVSNVIVQGITAPSTVVVGGEVSGWLDYNTAADYRFTSDDGYSAFYDNLFTNGSISVGSYEWRFDSSLPNSIGMLSSLTNDKPMPGATFDFIYLWTSLSKQTPFIFAPGAEYGSINISGGTTDLNALQSSAVPTTLELLRFAPSFQLMQLNTDTNEQLSVFASISSFTTAPVPEPSSAILFAIGIALAGTVVHKRRSVA